MKRFEEQPMGKSDNKPPGIIDVGAKMFVKAHSLHDTGEKLLGSVVFESTVYHSLDISTQNVINPDISNKKTVEILNKERADLERADELAWKIRNGEIGKKKKRLIVAEGGVKRY